MAPKQSKVSFILNGEPVEVPNPGVEETLLSFLRRTARLKGTKGVCYQGGCGSCTVLLSSPAAATLEEAQKLCGDDSSVGGGAVSHRAVNSCLRPLCSVDGLAVTTVEGVGSVTAGMHEVQKQLRDHNGSQCGFCTPGFVMSMYAQLKHKGQLGPEEAETIADGNICRCTGYRPILDAFQSLSCGGCKSAKGVLQGALGVPQSLCTPEIEDLCVASGRCVKASVAKGEGGIPKSAVSLEVVDPTSGVMWRTVASLEELFAAMQQARDSTRLVCGNTSTGVFPPRPASLVLDVSRVPELRTIKVTSAGITLGGAVTLSELMETLDAGGAAAGSCAPLLGHLRRVAGHQVRNVGSVVGNLVMTRQHPDFPSDVATLLTGLGASLAVAVCDGSEESPVVKVDLLSFLRKEGSPAGVNDDKKVVVLSVHIPAVRKPSQKFLTFKVAQRAVNSHALVNAAFLITCDPTTGLLGSPPVLVFGGVQPLPCRAYQTSAFLAGQAATDPGVIQHALGLLSSELAPEPSSKKAAYRAMLARSFLYKGLLSTIPREKLPADLVTTVTPFERPISTGQVSFDGDPSEYPVSKPEHKLSSAIQTTGEAQYLDDMDYIGEVHAVYVRSSVACAVLAGVDASAALALDGVEAFLSAQTLEAEGFSNRVWEGEELLASSRVVYHGQPVGIILTQSPALAYQASTLVKVSYTNIQPPILTLDDAVRAKSFFPDRRRELKLGSFDAAAAAADSVVSGSSGVGHQYHMSMETQRALSVPGEDGQLTVYSSTQSPPLTQAVVSKGTGVPLHKVKVVVQRVGGAYGGKASRSVPVALASALCAVKLGRPVRLVLDLSANMQMVGGRSPYQYSYSVAADKDGRIRGIKLGVLNNHGAHPDLVHPEMLGFLLNVDNVYNIETWDVDCQVARTNLPACTWIRAPGNVESLFIMETMIEHVAAALGLDPEAVRERNLYRPGDVTIWGDKLTYCNAGLVIDTIKASAGFSSRVAEVRAFNSASRWVKRGVALAPIKYCLPWAGAHFIALLNVYPDGSVSLAHSGVEMGQGMNVKAAQVASFSLGAWTLDGCPLARISIKETTTDVANNTSPTGGSVGSELCCMATKGACDILAERLKPVALQLRGRNRGVRPTWQELIGQAVAGGVDLQARYRAQPGASSQGMDQYVSFGAAVTEVEVDLLTGEFRLLRSDLLLDCGTSLNPAVDVGQVQGAFVMGLGYLLTEEFDFDKETGKLVTDSTWEYKPPSYADIPIDLRASLLQNSGNPQGFLRSKASGEPPLAMACSALFAIRHALVAGRKEVATRLAATAKPGAGEDPSWVALPAPATVERVCLTAGIPQELFTL